MKNLITLLAFAALIASTFQACYYDVEEELYPTVVDTCDTTMLLTYNNSIQNFAS